MHYHIWDRLLSAILACHDEITMASGVAHTGSSGLVSLSLPSTREKLNITSIFMINDCRCVECGLNLSLNWKIFCEGIIFGVLKACAKVYWI